MNRRSFLALVAAGVSADVADRLLWVPKAMITVPAMPQGLMFRSDAFELVMGDMNNPWPFTEEQLAAAAKDLANSIDRAAFERLYLQVPDARRYKKGMVLAIQVPEINPLTRQATGQRVPRLFTVTSV